MSAGSVPRPLRGLHQVRHHRVEWFHVTIHEPAHPRSGALALLVHEQHELGVLRHEVDVLSDEQPRARFVVEDARLHRDVAQAAAELCERAVDRRLPELLLAAEVVGDEAVVDPGARGDLTRGRRVEALARKEAERGDEDRFAALGASFVRCPGHGAWILGGRSRGVEGSRKVGPGPGLCVRTNLLYNRIKRSATPSPCPTSATAVELLRGSSVEPQRFIEPQALHRAAGACRAAGASSDGRSTELQAPGLRAPGSRRRWCSSAHRRDPRGRVRPLPGAHR